MRTPYVGSFWLAVRSSGFLIRPDRICTLRMLTSACGIASFNNLFPDGSGVDLAAHAASLGADTYKVAGLAELESALPEMRAARRTSVAVITTDPALSTSV